jgi:hypothetical protein
MAGPTNQCLDQECGLLPVNIGRTHAGDVTGAKPQPE